MFARLESQVCGLFPVPIWTSDMTPPPWAHEGTGAREIKVRGLQKCGRKCRETPVLQTADYLYMAWGPLESWGSPLWGTHREYVTSNLTMTSRHFVLRFSEGGKKNWTCLVITGVLMLAVLSEDAVLCHYWAPALIIDSIKMAVKLDVPISSGACCLF